MYIYTVYVHTLSCDILNELIFISPLLVGDIPKEHRSKVDSMFTLIVAEQEMAKGNLTKVLLCISQHTLKL
jgi:hypothetical protein